MAIPFDQDVKVYDAVYKMQSGVRKAALLGYYIHTIGSYHGVSGEVLMVVYRKDKK